MKYNCALCRQDINRYQRPVYDWRDTKQWIISCANCKAKLKPMISISSNEKAFLIFWDIYIWVIFIVYTFVILLSWSLPKEYELLILIAFPISMAMHLMIPLFYKNTKQIETIPAE